MGKSARDKKRLYTVIMEFQQHNLKSIAEEHLPTDDSNSAPSYVYSPSIIEPAAHSMADAFVQRVLRYRPEDRAVLVKLVRERIKANAPEIAAVLANEM